MIFIIINFKYNSLIFIKNSFQNHIGRSFFEIIQNRPRQHCHDSNRPSRSSCQYDGHRRKCSRNEGIRLRQPGKARHAAHGPPGEYRQRQLCLQQPERTDRRRRQRKTYGYSYDNIGNRKTAREDAEEATAYTTGPLNQYTAIERGEESVFEPVHDADGNQTLIRTSTGIWQVAYNAENRPVRFVNESAKTVEECAYDYMGKRHIRKVSVRWFLFWDPTQPEATRPLAIRKDGT